MPVTGKIVEQMLRSVQTVAAADSVIEESLLEDWLHQFRAEMAGIAYNGSRTVKANKLIPSSFYQSIEINKVFSDQDTDNEYVTFSLGSPPIRLDDRTNGLLFVGNRNSTASFLQVASHEHLSILQQKGYRNERDMYYMSEGNLIRIYGNRAIRKIFVKTISENPLNISGFVYETDNYPIPVDLIPQLLDFAKARFLREVEAVVPDITHDENPKRRIK